MNALIRKEIRLLGPSWMIGMVLLLSPALLSRAGSPVGVVGLLLVAGIALPLITSLDAFGREFGSGTFSSLLALPVSRERVWWTKIAVLAAALVCLYLVWWLSFNICAARWPELERNAADNSLTPLSSALFLIATFSSGLWTMLVFRQVAAAIWFAILIPLVLMVGSLSVLGRFSVEPAHQRLVLGTIAFVYALGGVLWAWRLFARAEDAQWTGGVVTLPRWTRFKDLAAVDKRARRFRPLVALIRKELQLHHAMVLMAGVLFVLHVGVILFRTYGGGFAKNPMVEPFLAVFGGLWILLPLLIGCTAVAEERKYGIMESQLIQPASGRRQVVVKFTVALVLSVLLGALPAWLLESFSPSLFREGEANSIFWSANPLFFASVILAGLALYASSLSRNILQALGFAVALIFLSSLFLSPGFGARAVWMGTLGRFLCYPILGVTLAVLAWKNARRPSITSRDWFRNISSLVTAGLLGLGLTTAIYHRAWELFRPMDPPRGLARFSLTDPVRMAQDGSLSVINPDGELLVSSWPQFWGASTPPPSKAFESFGTNWANAVALFFETIAIRRDGTLWVSEFPAQQVVRSTDLLDPPAPLVQFGVETNWLQVARDSRHARSVFLLKNDGTLWRWQDTNRAPDRVPLIASQPRRLGQDADWARIEAAGHRIYLTKSDGQVWCINAIFRSRARESIELEPGLPIHRWWDLDGFEWQSLAGAGMFDLGVRTDGTLWAMGVLRWGPRDAVAPIDSGTDWRGIAGNLRMGLAVKRDGTLWKLDWEEGRERPKPQRLGQRSDWIAVAGLHNLLYAMAADGSVWKWDTQMGYDGRTISLAPSRIPRPVGNIFGGQ